MVLEQARAIPGNEDGVRLAHHDRTWRESIQGKAMAVKRSGLPIMAVRSGLLEALTSSDVVIVCGDTGCGKTTQVGGWVGVAKIQGLHSGLMFHRLRNRSNS